MSPPDAEATLCLSCAMCCNGALYAWVPAREDELDRLRAQDFPLEPIGEPPRTGWRQPCPKLQGTACTVYQDRPAACRKYACQVLGDLREGTVTLDEALAATATANGLAAAATATLDAGQSLPDIRRAFVPDAHPLSRAEAEQRLRVATLGLFLDRRFRRPDEEGSLAMSVIGTEEKGPQE
ncbi:YkgJ family cysteine cluster protein [Sphingomonas humi]|uniref:YkgJ family cysteine cluster protein n=1 Tax=Sphingomonas humi TaxID=335630 RepID=A0ABP7S883_9SPHN